MRLRRILTTAAVLVLAGTLAACGSGGAGGADDYPTKPITIVVHGDAGSGADLFARNLGPVLSDKLGTSVVVQNMPGGSSANAMNYLAGQPSDGYTLLGMTDTFLINPLLNDVQYDQTDTTPIARMLIDPMVVYVRSDSPIGSLDEMMESLKTTTMRWGVPQVGSPETIVIDKMIEQYDPKIKVSTYEDGAQALLGVLSGDIDASVAEPAEIIGQVEADKVRILGTFTSERSPSLPDVPTFKETGYDAVIDKFRGVSGPADLPDTVVSRVADALQEVSDDPEYQASLKKNQQIPAYLKPEDFATFIDKQTEYYRANVQ